MGPQDSSGRPAPQASSWAEGREAAAGDERAEGVRPETPACWAPAVPSCRKTPEPSQGAALRCGSVSRPLRLERSRLPLLLALPCPAPHSHEHRGSLYSTPPPVTQGCCLPRVGTLRTHPSIGSPFPFHLQSGPVWAYPAPGTCEHGDLQDLLPVPGTGGELAPEGSASSEATAFKKAAPALRSPGPPQSRLGSRAKPQPCSCPAAASGISGRRGAEEPRGQPALLPTPGRRLGYTGPQRQQNRPDARERNTATGPATHLTSHVHVPSGQELPKGHKHMDEDNMETYFKTALKQKKEGTDDSSCEALIRRKARRSVLKVIHLMD